MRNKTRRKLWGRARLVVELRSTIQEIEAAMKAAELPGIHGREIIGHLRAAIANCYDAGQAMDIFKVDRKRIRAALEKERERLAKIMDMARVIPITVGEKAVAKTARAKAKEGKLNGYPR
jgi:hypothetical protein